MIENNRMTMTGDEIRRQEEILQEIIRRHEERQSQMRKDEELARQMNFNQLREVQEHEASKQLS